jgi:hypothetical protein
MLTRFQVMAIATAIKRHESEVFGDSCLTINLCDIIRDAAQELEYYHENPLDALKQTESHLTDAVNMLDQANDRTKLTTDLGKEADALLGEVQRLIRDMERPEQELGDDGHDTLDWETR